MSSSSGKTLGLIIFILFILLIAYSIAPFVFGPLHMVNRHLFNISFLHGLGNGGWPFFGLFKLFPLLMLIIWVGVTIWVYRDAEERRMNGVLWALLVFVGNVVGLIIYLIVRNGSAVTIDTPAQLVTCPSCERRVPERFSFCPHCGTQLKKNCPSCGKPAQGEWKVCPYCGEKLSGL